MVNNAGVAGMIGPAEWMTREDYVRTLNVNLFGVIETSRVFLPLLRRERGRLVNMSSANGSVTVPFFVPYTISKYGVEIFSDNLRCVGPCIPAFIYLFIHIFINIRCGQRGQEVAVGRGITPGIARLFDP